MTDTVAGSRGTAFWNDFYGSILGNGIGSAGPDGSSNSALQNYNTAAVKPVWATQAQTDYKALLKAKNDAAIESAKPRGTRNVVMPDGSTIASSGSASLDFMRGILGVSPLDGSAKTTTGDAVAPGSGSGFDLNATIASLMDNFGAPLVAILVAGGLVWYGTAKALKV